MHPELYDIAPEYDPEIEATQNNTGISTRLFIDKENLLVEYITVKKTAGKIERKGEVLSFAKSAKVYGLQNEIDHLVNTYRAHETIFCELT